MTVDVLLVTALQIEMEAARTAGSRGYANHPGVNSWTVEATESMVPYSVGAYRLSDGSQISIALARPTRMGISSTAPVAAALAERLKPKCLAMCGICAGNPTRVTLGDVVVAELTYAYDEGLRASGSFQPDHRQIAAADVWIRAAQDISTDDLRTYGPSSTDIARSWLLECLYSHIDPTVHPARSRYVAPGLWPSLLHDVQAAGLIYRDGRRLLLTDRGFATVEEWIVGADSRPTALPFAVVVGPMASGSAVVREGQSTWDQLIRHGVRTIAGLEMESAAVAQTAHRLGISDWIVAKGVVDYADPTKSDRYHEFAAQASAEVLFKLLALQTRNKVDLRRRGRSSVRSVYVIGGITGETDHPDYEQPELADFCQRLGLEVAQAGADLVVCSPFSDSADFHALRGYLQSELARTVHLHMPKHTRVDAQVAEMRSLLGAAQADKIRIWTYPGPDSETADSWTQAWLLCQLMALDHAEAVISVGGRASNTANTLLHLAEARQKPLLPYTFLGGASLRAFNRRKWGTAYPGLDSTRFQDRSGVAEAMSLAEEMLAARISGAHNYTWPPRRVFVSRARADAHFASALDDYFATVGIEPLLGEREWQPDQQTVESAIVDAVLGADLFVVLWSSHFATSRFCNDELDLAMQRHAAGALQVWIVNLDGSDVVPRAARTLPQIIATSPQDLVALIKNLLERGQI
jgi:nucleoside phosphorylase